MQYTLRNIPEALDEALREKARREGRSLNEVAIEAMLAAMGLADRPLPQRDLSDVAGTWEQDDETTEALTAQRRIDPDLWR